MWYRSSYGKVLLLKLIQYFPTGILFIYLLQLLGVNQQGSFNVSTFIKTKRLITFL